MDSPSWYTPSDYVEAAREVMGGIDLDPMSDEEANQTVQAARFYTEAENGLTLPLYGRVFYNPAGSLVDEAWKHVLRGPYEQLIWIGYSLEQLQTLQTKNSVTPLDFPICYPRKRIPFVENRAKQLIRIATIIRKGEADGATEVQRKAAAWCRAGKPPKDAPSHANYIAYLGTGRGTERFEDVFSRFGKVRV